jgi:hypothetical protein
MGLHTWFEKDKELFNEVNSLYEKLYKHENYEIFLDEIDIIHIEVRISEIEELNKTDFHDCFRNVKRNKDGSYTDDIIYSEEECMKYLIYNKEFIQSVNRRRLWEFWDKYPNGVIYFG